MVIPYCWADSHALLTRSPLSTAPKGGFTFDLHVLGVCWVCLAVFSTAASRRSLGRVSVPVWLIVLSDQLRIVALVGHYPTNKLIRLGLIL